MSSNKYIEFPTLASTPAINDSWLYQKEYKHDVLVMKQNNYKKNGKDFRMGTPIVHTYTAGSAAEIFYGYIDHIVPSPADNRRNLEVEIVCGGATWPAKDQNSGTYTQASLESISSMMAQRYGLTVVGVPTNYNFASLTQAAQSDWDFWCEVAARVGYSLHNQGMVVYALPRDVTMPQVLKRDAYVFVGPNTTHGTDATLLDYKVIIDETAAKIRLNAGIDARTKKIITNTHSGQFKDIFGALGPTPRFVEYVIDPVDSVAESYQKLFSIAAANRFFVKGIFELVGMPRLQPGRILYLDNVDPQLNGAWYISETVHSLVSSRYTTQVVAYRDSVGDNGIRPDKVGVVFDSKSLVSQHHRTKISGQLSFKFPPHYQQPVVGVSSGYGANLNPISFSWNTTGPTTFQQI